MLTALMASAFAVTIGDPSFEGNSLNDSQWTHNIGPEWQESGGSGNSAGFEERIAGFVADGTDHLGMELNHDVWQDLGVTYQPNTRYTLTVAIGHRSGVTQAGNQSQYLLADADGAIHASGAFNASTLPAQTFGDAPVLVLDTPQHPSAVGESIRILLRARGQGRSHFDHIRLEATPLQPPGTAEVINLPASDVLATSATLNGEINSMGDDAPTVTIFWGSEDGGVDAEAWGNSFELAGTWDGAFSAAISGLEPGSSYQYRARATNSEGESWAFASSGFETLPLSPAVVTLPASEVAAFSAKLGAEVTSTGGEIPTVTVYYGTADGGTDSSEWAGSVIVGPLVGAGDVLVGGLTQNTNYHCRAFAQNSAGGVWAPGSLSFTTASVLLPAVENRSASGITGTTADLRGTVTGDGNDPPSVTIFFGTSDGDTEEGNWEFSEVIPATTGDFARFVTNLEPSTTYYFRSRVINSAGTVWADESASFTTTPLVPATAVINEFFYNPKGNATLEEFIELHNPGDTALDISGWTLSDALSYTFPPGTTLPPGGYVVVGEHPQTLEDIYGITALGPWSGKLSSRGERIDLNDAGGNRQDRVEYGAGFPWPTAADGAGSSAELIHPALDNDLGGSWRASGMVSGEATVYIPAQAQDWKYFKGTQEASSPVDDWRGASFDDSAWLNGQAGIGYGDPGVNTTVSDMRYTYSSLYFRKSFTVSPSGVPSRLKLRIRIDDGCVIWINGVEVDRRYVGPGQLAHNYLAPANHDNDLWDEVILENADNYLVGGTNVIAVHGFNTTLGSSDFSMDLELADARTDSPLPTPGMVNSVHAPLDQIPPQIRQVAHSPITPVTGQEVRITARLTDPDGMGEVVLSYQIVEPGAYIRLTDPAYQTDWTPLPMNDDGSDGDLVAGDSIFTCVLPGTLQSHRRLIRYRITFEDGLQNSQAVPYADDEQPNFAYFVYDGVPSWSGALRPQSFGGAPATEVQTYSSETLSSITPFHLVANATDVTNSQYVGGFQNTRFTGTVVEDGKVFDHIQFRVRGIGSTYQSGKNKWNIYFNRARDYQAKDNYGRPYQRTWNNLLLNANASPWAAAHRGSAGIEEASSHRLYQLSGMAAMHTQYLHLRVIDDAVEVSPSSQYDGDLWGLYLGLEPTEGNFIDERGLADGNLYSIEGNAGDKKRQGPPPAAVDSSDWNAFRDGLAQAGQTEQWYRDHIDLPSLYTFLAINRLIGNVDVRPGDNYRFYLRPTDNRWVIIPYDLDMMYIAAHHWAGTMDGVVAAGAPNVIRAISRHPALALEYRNRCREILGLMASDGTPGGGQIGQLLDEYASFVAPPGTTLNWANLDAAMWNLHPRTPGNGSNSGQSSHRGNFFRANYLDGPRGAGGAAGTTSWVRTLGNADASGFSNHAAIAQWMVDYATNTWPGGAWNRKAMTGIGTGVDSDVNRQKGFGYQYLLFESKHGGWINSLANPDGDGDLDMPVKPVITSIGGAGFPVNDLSFRSSEFSDPQGPETHAASQWRIAEIQGPGVPGWVLGTPRRYEIEATWDSGEVSTSREINVPLGVAAAGKTYRVRVRHKDSSGRWSFWSEPAAFISTPSEPGDLVHYWNFNSTSGFQTPSFTKGGAVFNFGVTGIAEVVTHNAQDQGFAGLNARLSDPIGRHLRINNPIGATLTFEMPTTGYEDIVIQYETRRSGQGAHVQVIRYTLDGENYQDFREVLPEDVPSGGVCPVESLDFRSVPGVADNPDFAIRFTFLQGGGGTAGNNRIDNLTMEGDPLPHEGYAAWQAAEFENQTDPSAGPYASAAGDGVANLIRYALGLGALDPVAGLMPVISGAAGDERFRFYRDESADDVIWRVKSSSDLEDWTEVVFDSTLHDWPDAENGWLEFEVPSSSETPRHFLRLELEWVE